jgi:hypothetical protein
MTITLYYMYMLLAIHSYMYMYPTSQVPWQLHSPLNDMHGRKIGVSRAPASSNSTNA